MKKSTPLWLMLGLLVVGSALAWRHYQEAQIDCIHSYVLSVQRAVDDFHRAHGRFPGRLNEINASALDYDCGIALDQLHYDVSDNRPLIWYQSRNKRIPDIK
jgi:hypothetical protein